MLVSCANHGDGGDGDADDDDGSGDCYSKFKSVESLFNLKMQLVSL